MKRTITSRLAETLFLIITWPISLIFCIAYLGISITLDIANRMMTCWTE